jgi:hypothetical protein
LVYQVQARRSSTPTEEVEEDEEEETFNRIINLLIKKSMPYKSLRVFEIIG